MINQRISDFHKIVASRHDFIISVAGHAWNRVKSKGEVLRIREFLSEKNKGVHTLNRWLPKLFIKSGFELKFAAILVHASPIVIPLKNFERDIPKDSLSANPELGDLNLVFIYMDRTKVVRCARSILYQAKQKRASNKEAISQGHQKYLYDHAQGFRYKDGKFANSKRRLPVASLRRRGMQYLFVSETPVQCSPVPSDNPAFIPWAESLFRFLLDAEGVIIASGIAKGNGWSKINEDLVTIFRDDNELKTHNISELASWFNDFKDPNHWYAKADEKSVGVSTLFVIVRDQKLPPDKNKRELQNKKIKTRISSK